MPNDKLKMWDAYNSWDQAENAWDLGVDEAKRTAPIKGLTSLPSMPGMTEETAKNLKWKSLKWIVTQDHRHEVLRGFLKHPFKYGWAYLKSIFKSKPHIQDGDFFFYGIRNLAEFEKLVADPRSLFVLGFSYCHKPFECPSGRFTPDCIRDADNPVCRQCLSGNVCMLCRKGTQ